MIRPLTLEDGARAAQLHSAGFDRAWDVDAIKWHIENDVALGYYTTSLRGFVLAQSVADQAEILTITVAPEDRKTGIGVELLKASEQVCIEKGADILFLEVAEDNHAAIALYKKSGYESFGRRPAYYKRECGRVAARLFRKNLNAAA